MKTWRKLISRFAFLARPSVARSGFRSSLFFALRKNLARFDLKTRSTTNEFPLATFVAVVAFLLWASVASLASAQIVPACGQDGTGPCTLCDLWKLGHNIINFLLWSLAIPVLTVLLLWGGTVWATSAGSPGRIEQGKKTMTTGLVGIIIALSAWLVVDTLIKTFAADGEFKAAWNKFPECAEPIKVTPVAAIPPPLVEMPPLVDPTQEYVVRDRLKNESGGNIQVNRPTNELCSPYGSQTSGCTNVGGLREKTIQEVLRIQKDIGTSIMINGGSETDGHSCGYGAKSHCSGYKVDFALDPTLDKYIRNNFKQICDSTTTCKTELGRSDVSEAYRRKEDELRWIYYNLELKTDAAGKIDPAKSHWDVLVQ